MEAAVKKGRTANSRVKSKVKISRLEHRKSIQLSILAIPGIIWFLIFCYVPMGGIVIAFKNYKANLGIFGSKWVGLDNFKFLFSTNDAYIILRNTILYNFASIILTAVVAVGIALLLDTIRNRICLRVYQTALFLPRFISWVVGGYMALILFRYDYGLLNHLRAALGMEPVSWYLETKYWPAILMIANIWKSMGYNCLVYYGSIIGIDSEIYEAAEIDGATSWRKIRYITLPLIKPTIITLSLMSIGSIMRSDFGLFYYVPNNSGALYSVTNVLDTYIYRALRITGDMAGSAAGSVFQSIAGFIMVVACNALVRKIDPDSSLF